MPYHQDVSVIADVEEGLSRALNGLPISYGSMSKPSMWTLKVFDPAW
jgi:hypothetical protein